MTPELYSQVKKLFLEAADLSDQERREFLDRACGTDAELRHEVESLLGHHSTSPLLKGTESQGDTDRDSSPADSKRPGTTSVMSLTVGWVSWVHRHRVVLVLTFGVMTLGTLGLWSHEGVRKSVRAARVRELQAVLDTHVAAVDQLFEAEANRHSTWARSELFRAAVSKLAASKDPSVAAPQRALLATRLQELAGADAQVAVWSPDMIALVDPSPSSLPTSDRLDPKLKNVLERALRGETIVQTPSRSSLVEPSHDPEAGSPTMSVVTPILSLEDPQRVIGALVVQDSSFARRFWRILASGRSGNSGETYAFGPDGLLLSDSRFSDQLRQWGLLPERQASAILTVTLRDPGGDLTSGFRPAANLEQRPLTKMAAAATAFHDGSDVEGYHNYLGVKSVGAWRWLKRWNLGVASEMSAEEAYQSLSYFNFGFGAAGIMFVLSIGVLVVVSGVADRLQQQTAAGGVNLPSGVQQLGAYTLERLIGEGGMGTVYLARHALLKRPTAVKLLRPDQVTRQSIARFEREVQLVSTLTHPNTIQVYDYGRTAEGVFYYAMEFVDGFTFDELVRMEGFVSPARAIFLLRQACLAIQEAHSRGLIHRDIKPQNLMLCQRGGAADFVKVLDFGLVKDLESNHGSITSTGAFAGTPLYMSPERMRNPLTADARVDVYALGAVAYRLLTGFDLYDGTSSIDVFLQAMSERTPRPSERAAQPIPLELDELVQSCLRSNPDDRPRSIDELIAALERVPLHEPWGQAQATLWWLAHSATSAGQRLAQLA